MSKTFAITATRTVWTGASSRTAQVPTFYIDGTTSGVLDSNGAAGVARTILSIGVVGGNVTFNICAVEI